MTLSSSNDADRCVRACTRRNTCILHFMHACCPSARALETGRRSNGPKRRHESILVLRLAGRGYSVLRPARLRERERERAL